MNFCKSQLVGLNTYKGWLAEAVNILNCKKRCVPFKYLGLPIGVDPCKKSTWFPMVEKVRKRLSSWSGKYLSFGCRIVLIKSVLLSIPIYFLSFFKAPKGIISSLESFFKTFLWGGKEGVRKISWAALGMSFVEEKKSAWWGRLKNLRAFNLALVGKWIWRMKVEKHMLWH